MIRLLILTIFPAFIFPFTISSSPLYKKIVHTTDPDAKCLDVHHRLFMCIKEMTQRKFLSSLKEVDIAKDLLRVK